MREVRVIGLVRMFLVTYKHAAAISVHSDFLIKIFDLTSKMT